MIREEFLVVEKPCDNADEKHYQKLIISDNGALFEGMYVCVWWSSQLCYTNDSLKHLNFLLS